MRFKAYRRRSDFGYRSAQRGITRSRRNGAWDLRRGPRLITVERERWTAAFLAYQHAMAARCL